MIISGFIIWRRPFKSWLENATLISNNVCYIIILTLFLVVDKNESMSQKDKYSKLGVPILIFIIIILVMNTIVALATIGSLVVKACRKLRKGSHSKVSDSGESIKVFKLALANMVQQHRIKTIKEEYEIWSMFGGEDNMEDSRINFAGRDEGELEDFKVDNDQKKESSEKKDDNLEHIQSKVDWNTDRSLYSDKLGFMSDNTDKDV